MKATDFIDLLNFSTVKTSSEFILKIAQILFCFYCISHFIEAGILFWNNLTK